jgi:hypothetical protein
LQKIAVNISRYNLPQISTEYINNTNQLIEEELNYDLHSLETESNKLYSQLNNDQKKVFHQIHQAHTQSNYLQQSKIVFSPYLLV